MLGLEEKGIGGRRGGLVGVRGRRLWSGGCGSRTVRVVGVRGGGGQ